MLGSHHSVTLDEMRSMGELLEDAGKVDAAEGIMRTEVSRLRDILGDAHPDTLTAISRLARLIASHDRGDASRLAEAEALMREDLKTSRAALGEAHIDTLAALAALAQVLCKQRQHAEAAGLAREAVALSARLLGSAHEHTTLMRQLERHAVLEDQREETRRREASLLLLASWPSPGDGWMQATL